MDDFTIDLRGLVGLLRRQSRFILLTLLTVLGLAALVVFSLTPIFAATALVLVDTSQKNLLAPELVTTMGAEDSRVQSEVEILKSDFLLLKIVERQNLMSDPEFGPRLGVSDRVLAFLQIAEPSLPTGEEALQAVLKRVSSAVTVSRRSTTNIIALEGRSTDPNRAAEIANAWASAYIDEQLAAKIDRSLAARDILRVRLAEARAAIVRSEGALDEFIDDNLGTIVDETGRTDIANLRQNINETAAARERDEARTELAMASLGERDWRVLTQTLQSDALSELDRQRQALERTLASAPEERAIELRSELERLEEQLVSTAAGDITTLRRGVNAAEARETELRQQLRSTVLSSSLSPDLLAGIYEVQQSAELARLQYQTLLARAQDFDAQSALQVADSRIVSPALAPSSPAFPRTGPTLAIAGLSGLVLGVFFAFLRENLLGGLLTEDQTEAVLKLPVAAAVPRQRGSDADGDGGLAARMVSDPMSPFAEAIRRIRAAIDQASQRHRLIRRDGAPRPPSIVIMVTSATANEGKSTIALSLARTYGLSGQSVMLIDCDLRKPAIHRMIGAEPSDAFAAALASIEEQPDFATIARKDANTGVETIAGARPSGVPTDQLIASENFARLIEWARARCNVVVLDTPPIGPIVDALYLAAAADVILFVVRSGSTSQTEARLALSGLMGAKREGARVLTVLNQQDRASASYKSRYDSYYYSEA
jgi:uncharacterized protein involved in exopolysaccharide biosynthesis/Mrp family chromosome partitioning ATPase